MRRILISVAAALVALAGIGATIAFAVGGDDGDAGHQSDQGHPDVQREMREDLAARLGISVDEIAVASFREVTWPNGCLGVGRPNETCIQALIPGVLAELSAGGEAYRYHGGDGRIVATDFESGADISDPYFD
jgi:hypothetical protein